MLTLLFLATVLMQHPFHDLQLRYRRQMEEMQKAFNKTIIKLQNTSRVAEEQVSKEGAL